MCGCGLPFAEFGPLWPESRARACFPLPTSWHPPCPPWPAALPGTDRNGSSYPPRPHGPGRIAVAAFTARHQPPITPPNVIPHANEPASDTRRAYQCISRVGIFASAPPRYAASASRRAVTLPTTHVLISGSRARVSGHLHTAFERVRHCLGRYISRVYRIPPRAARTAGILRSVYAPSGPAFVMHPYPSVYAPSSSEAGTAFALHAVPIGIRPERPASRY